MSDEKSSEKMSLENKSQDGNRESDLLEEVIIILVIIMWNHSLGKPLFGGNNSHSRKSQPWDYVKLNVFTIHMESLML